MKESGSMTSSSPSKPWSDTRNGRIVIIAGVVGLFVLVFWLATKSRRMLSEPAALVVDEQHLWFGEVWEESAFAWALPIHNTTNEDIEIASFAADCACGKVKPPSLTIPAQGTEEVHLTLDLRSRPTGKPDFTGKDFNIRIQPLLRKRVSALSGWIVHGRAVRPFVIEPPVVDFGESLIREQPFMPRSAIITCGLDVAELTAYCDSPFLTAKVACVNPRRYRLEIQAQKKIPSGPFKHPVKLTALTPSKKTVTGTVYVVGRVLEDVILHPDVLVFGAMPLGTTVQETIVLHSRTGQDFAIQEVDRKGAERIVVDVDRKEKDGEQRFHLSLTVKELGPYGHTINVKVKTTKALLEIPLPIICHGIPAKAALVTQ
jgi:hypothetical protein